MRTNALAEAKDLTHMLSGTRLEAHEHEHASIDPHGPTLLE